MNPLKKLYRHLTNWRWEIGFLENSLDGVVAGEPLNVHWVNLPFRDRWFADPFILDYNEDEIIVLGEEYSDELLRGRIGKMVIDRKTYELKSWKIILDLPTHLSFPRVVRKDGEIYIHPENSKSGCHTIYEYDFKNDKLVEGKVICDMPLTDSIMLEHEGRDLLFSTYLPTPNGEVLSVFEKKDGKYVEIDKIDLGYPKARMAGDFFVVNGQLYRPAQDTNGEYGNATYIQKVEYENGKWMFTDVRKLTSTHPILKKGLHTFNHYKDLTVIDVKGDCYPKLFKILRFLRYPFGKSKR